MKERARSYDLEIVGGHCSFNPEAAGEYYKIAEIEVSDCSGGKRRAIYGIRMVGLKSKTNLNPDGQGMGVDFSFYEQFLITGKKPEGIPPSVTFAENIVKETGLLIATEIMMPTVQLPLYEGRIPERKFMAWNASVDQLGWHLWQIAQFAKRNGWYLGIKNGKWLGDVDLQEAQNPNLQDETSLERTWKGLVSWVQDLEGRLILIHRGVDVSRKGDYRNAPVHEIARRARKITGAKLNLDPSHINGSKLRDKIVEDTIEAMRMKEDNDWLYSGILIEVGTSETDTEQHISVDELDSLARELARFRSLRSPESS